MSAPVEISPKIPGYAAFLHRDYRLFQAARLAAVIALEMQSVAVGWQVYELTHRPLDLGYVGLAQFLPGILLFLLAGHAADRYDRRGVLLSCYVGYAVCSALLLAYTWHGGAKAHPIFLIMLLLGVVRAFSGPASQALMPQLVPEEHFQNAVAWSSSIFMTATIVGPAVGGIIYALGGDAKLVYVLATATFVFASALVILVHTRTGRLEHREISLETLFAGFKYVWRQKVILGSISLDLFAVLLGGAVALLPIYAKEILHVGAAGLGMLRSAPGVGAATMAALVAFRPIRKRAGILMLACVTIFGISTLVFGVSRNLYVSLTMLVILGAADMVSVVIRSTLVQISTPAAMRGRVSAVNLLFIGASNEFGEFESGITAQWMGAVRAVVAGGIGTLIIVALYAWKFPELRDVDSLSPAERS